MTARRPNRTRESHGANAAEYKRWRALSKAVRSTIPGQARPLAT